MPHLFLPRIRLHLVISGARLMREQTPPSLCTAPDSQGEGFGNADKRNQQQVQHTILIADQSRDGVNQPEHY